MKDNESKHKRVCRIIALVFLAFITFGIFIGGIGLACNGAAKKDEVDILRRQEQKQDDLISEIVKEGIKQSQYK